MDGPDDGWAVPASGLLARLPGVPLRVMADGTMPATPFCEHVWNPGSRHPMIPPQRHEAPFAGPARICHNQGRRPWDTVEQFVRQGG